MNFAAAASRSITTRSSEIFEIGSKSINAIASYILLLDPFSENILQQNDFQSDLEDDNPWALKVQWKYGGPRWLTKGTSPGLS